MNLSASPDQKAYFEQVWAFVRQVPYGNVVTYGQIAKALPADDLDLHELDATGSRLVGSAMAACPADVPWHRVVNAQGKVSNRAGAQQQHELLVSEGVCFIQGKLDMDEYQWLGADKAKRPKQFGLF